MWTKQDRLESILLQANTMLTNRVDFMASVPWLVGGVVGLPNLTGTWPANAVLGIESECPVKRSRGPFRPDLLNKTRTPPGSYQNHEPGPI